VQEYLSGKSSQRAIARRLNVDWATIKRWINNYEAIGREAFYPKGNQRYSKALKEQAVQDYLAGKGSQREICKKYKIKSTYQLQDWIKKYNGHEELKASRSGGNTIMTKGRKTTFDERVEIVQYCIAHDRNYAKTAKKYKVSYQQARSYTVKYEAGGIDALQDKRGRKKSFEEMTEVERLRAENKILRAEKEHAEMEASFLKKLEEIERRRG
jgi:transposase